MRVFEVRTSSEFYSLIDSGLDYRDPKRENLVNAVFLNESIAKTWEPLFCRKLDQSLPLGHFGPIDILRGLFVVFQSALSVKSIGEYLNRCEMLEIEVDSQTGFIVYVRQLFDVLDRDRSRLDLNIIEGREVTNFPVFDKKKLPSSGAIFRIEEAWNSVFLVEPDKGGFKYDYEKHCLSGLIFEEKPVV